MYAAQDPYQPFTPAPGPFGSPPPSFRPAPESFGLVLQPFWEDSGPINTDPWDSTPEPEWIRGDSPGTAAVDVLRIARKALKTYEEMAGPLDEDQQATYDALPAVVEKWEGRISFFSELADALTDKAQPIPGLPNFPKQLYKLVTSELADPTQGIISVDRETDILAAMGEVYQEGGQDLADIGAVEWANVLGDVIDVEWAIETVIYPASYESALDDAGGQLYDWGKILVPVGILAGIAYVTLMLK